MVMIKTLEPKEKKCFDVELATAKHKKKKKKSPFRPPETFHFAFTAWLDSTEHRLFSVLQIRLVAVIERLLLIRNQCKTPAHAAACSLPSADRGGTFSLTGLTLALCGASHSEVALILIPVTSTPKCWLGCCFSPLQRAMHGTPHHLRQPLWHYFYVDW